MVVHVNVLRANNVGANVVPWLSFILPMLYYDLLHSW
jgi:hypothetical protein